MVGLLAYPTETVLPHTQSYRVLTSEGSSQVRKGGLSARVLASVLLKERPPAAPLSGLWLEQHPDVHLRSLRSHHRRLRPPESLSEAAAGPAIVNLYRSYSFNYKSSGPEQTLTSRIRKADSWNQLRQLHRAFSRRMNSHHLSALICRTATLVSANNIEPSTYEELVDCLVRQALPMAASFGPRDAAPVLRALRELNVRSPELVSALLSYNAAYVSLGLVNAAQLVSIAWTLEAMQQKPPEAWVQALYTHMMGSWSTFKVGGLAHIVKALRSLDMCPPDAWLSGLYSHAHKRLEEFTPCERHRIFMSMALFGVRPPLTAIEGFLEAALPQLGELHVQQLTRMIWVLAKLKHTPNQAWLRQYFRHTMGMLRQFRPKDLTVIILSIADSRNYPGDAWLEEFFDRSEACLSRFTMAQLSTLGWAVAHMGLKPPRSWVQAFLGSIQKLPGALTFVAVLSFHRSLSSLRVPEKAITRRDYWVLRRRLFSARRGTKHAGLRLTGKRQARTSVGQSKRAG